MSFRLEDLSNPQRNYVEAIVIYMSKHDMDIEPNTTYPRSLLRAVSLDSKGKIWIPNWITHDLSRRSDRGVFLIPEEYEHFIQGEEETAVEDFLAETVQG